MSPTSQKDIRWLVGIAGGLLSILLLVIGTTVKLTKEFGYNEVAHTVIANHTEKNAENVLALKVEVEKEVTRSTAIDADTVNSIQSMELEQQRMNLIMTQQSLIQNETKEAVKELTQEIRQQP